MKTYYFIFNKNCRYRRCVQQVISNNRNSAEKIMMQKYGTCWRASFTQNEFNDLIRNKKYSELKPLTSIYV